MKTRRKSHMWIMQTGIVVFDLWINFVLYGTFLSPKVFAIRSYLNLRGASDTHVSIREQDGRKDIYIYIGGEVSDSSRIFAGIPNIVSIVGVHSEIDVSSLVRSPRLFSLCNSFGLLRNQEDLMHFDCLENLEGDIDTPLRNMQLVKKARKWGLRIRVTPQNIDMICHNKNSAYYDLWLDPQIIKKLSRDQIQLLRSSKYRRINNYRSDCFFEEYSELFSKSDMDEKYEP